MQHWQEETKQSNEWYKLTSSNFYPTLPCRVQITCETSTNITRYLYSSHSPDRVKDQNPWQVRILGETKTLDNKSLIRHFSVLYRCKFLLSFVFWLVKYTAILHTKTSNKIYLLIIEWRMKKIRKSKTSFSRFY